MLTIRLPFLKDPEFYHGAPVALQIVGRRLEEEKVLEMCEVIDSCLNLR